MEVAATLTSVVVAVVVLNRYDTHRDLTHFYVGLGCLATSLLDGDHGLLSSAVFRRSRNRRPRRPLPLELEPPPHLLGSPDTPELARLAPPETRRKRKRAHQRTPHLHQSRRPLDPLRRRLRLLPAYFPNLPFGRPQKFLIGALFIAAYGYWKQGSWRQDLEQFAYIASHDLKAPLRAIDNLNSCLEEDLEDLDDDNREKMKLLRGRVKRIWSDSPMTSSAGRENHKLDTRARIEDLTKILSLPDSFKVEAEEVRPILETERTPLEQVLRSLIDNAFKHHDKASGLVKIACRNRKSGKLEFAVSDDGPGVPIEHRKKAFELFQTLKPRDEVEGSGMGLALIKRLVARKAGRVSFDPKEGRGLTVRFTWSEAGAKP